MEPAVKAYAKPYVKRPENDTTDVEAFCKAVTRPNMRFVPTKTVEQQSCLMLHRARHLFIRQQTAVRSTISYARAIIKKDLNVRNCRLCHLTRVGSPSEVGNRLQQ
jgi:transposase